VENATINALNVQQADKRPQDKHLTANGPLLITHWGMSGPAVLRLSAWGARVLAACKYQFVLQVNWTGVEQNIIKEHLQAFRKSNGKKNVVANPLFNIPRRLWERLAEAALLTQQWRTINYADLSNKQTEQLIAILTACKFEVNGKSTFKDEFVTAGGIDSSEVDFKTMQSKKHQGLFFAGEVLNIDGITGGFNFQAAWTTGFIAGSSVI
jgi:predicted Rossmann fold flavoprotein